MEENFKTVDTGKVRNGWQIWREENTCKT